MRIDIKPLSVNMAWQGRRVKTKEYRIYEVAVHALLGRMKIPEGLLEVRILFGLSSMGGDVDNPAKPFIDCLERKYGFNDNKIMKLTLEKVKTAKGEEFIDFEIKPYV